jgi:acyl-coenzyme A thioesterase PaaI-like protein
MSRVADLTTPGPDVEAFASTERQRLAEAVRHLVDAVLTSEDATEDELAAATVRVEELAAELHGEAHAEPRPAGRRARQEVGHPDYLPRSPFVGTTSPVAPPFEWEWTRSRIIAEGVFGAAYEGPPGYVHGGWIALAFDEVLGMANIANETPGMTGKLNVRYRRPTPLHLPAHFEAWTDRIDGRRIVAHATLDAGGARTAEAEGLFVAISRDLAEQYFGRERDGTTS